MYVVVVNSALSRACLLPCWWRSRQTVHDDTILKRKEPALISRVHPYPAVFYGYLNVGQNVDDKIQSGRIGKLALVQIFSAVGASIVTETLNTSAVTTAWEISQGHERQILSEV